MAYVIQVNTPVKGGKTIVDFHTGFLGIIPMAGNIKGAKKFDFRSEAIRYRDLKLPNKNKYKVVNIKTIAG